jgi:hypothetical protein
MLDMNKRRAEHETGGQQIIENDRILDRRMTEYWTEENSRIFDKTTAEY